MPKQKMLEDLFLETLKDMYYAERQIVKALPKMAKAAESDELRTAFETHLEETHGQIERLQKVFEILGKRAQGKTCESIQGLIEEGEEIIEEFSESPALDAGLISAGNAVEHYEIARYGTLKTWATQLKMPEAAKLLEANLQEERKADELLTKLAMTSANKMAA